MDTRGARTKLKVEWRQLALLAASRFRLGSGMLRREWTKMSRAEPTSSARPMAHDAPGSRCVVEDLRVRSGKNPQLRE